MTGVLVLRRGERFHPSEVIASQFAAMHARLDALDEIPEVRS